MAEAAGLLAARGVRGFALLDSALPAPAAGRFATGRWSFLTLAPFGLCRVREGRAFWNGTPLAGPPLAALRRLCARWRLPAAEAPDVAPFRGGAAGYVAYDFGARLERASQPRLPGGVDDMAFGFHDVVAAHDHLTGRVTVFSSGFPETGAAGAARAARRGAQMQALLQAAAAAAPAAPGRGPALRFSASHDRPAWEAAVERVKDYIRAGDIYQANVARRFSAPSPPDFDAFALYRALRAENPAPFAAFMDFGDVAIASSSPERFLALRGGVVETRPIKGTARRSDDPREDAAIAAALRASEKDRAENVMIVDLLRNDLSRVARPHGVRVTALCALETYAGVHHLTSAVEAELAAGRDAFDLIAATFPGGSITGAPKIRAMDIIAEIEGRGRGVYCGAIGYIGFDGDMDLNVAIRTVQVAGGEISLHAGGGVTLLSDAAAEFEETEAKAARLFAAFRRLERGAPCC
ncbi:aminodeoxychorismate synthase component I [Camelimonas abortus]